MRRTNMLAALALATLATMPAGAEPALTLRSAGSGNNRRPTPPSQDTAIAREIAEHNSAVERRKAEKKAAKLARRGA